MRNNHKVRTCASSTRIDGYNYAALDGAHSGGLCCRIRNLRKKERKISGKVNGGVAAAATAESDGAWTSVAAL